MKAEFKRHRIPVLFAAGVAALALWSACDDNPTPTDAGNEPQPIAVSEIISTPKSPQPGDTIFLTAVVVSQGQNENDFPTVQWTASDGTFLENNQLSVRWVAPPTSALFTISCRATNSVNSATGQTQVFVSSPQVLVNANAGEVHPTGAGNELFYMSTMDIGEGTEVSDYVSGTSGPVVSDRVHVTLGENRVFSPDLHYSAHRVLRVTSGNLIQPMFVHLVDLVTGVEDTIAADRAGAGVSRRQQYDYPSFSPGSDYVAYQAIKPTPVQGIGGPDTIDVHVQNIATGEVQIPTFTHGGRRRNYFPTFSPDGAWLVFVSDRSAINRYDMYGLPISGGIVETDSAATVRLTNSGGFITVGSALTLPPPRLKWSRSASAPVFAVLGADDILRIVFMNGSGGTQVNVTGVEGRVRDFAWADDGQTLAVSNFATLYTVDLSGSATAIHDAQEGDLLRDLSWSPDGNWIAYRILRGGIGWYELFDVRAGRITEPAVLTSATSSNGVSTYSLKMSMAPVFGASDDLFLLEFVSPAQTPRITELDISGILQ